MSVNRVQKLLFSEYCDFEDMVLIESPFAQTTKEGRGIRQVHIGLTPSKLVLATDVLPPVDTNKVTYSPGVDPDIETFELIAIYPVECVNLSVYRRRKRQALKARFCNNRVLYFELGGFERRSMFWNLWCEKVKFLSPEDGGSSHSETSVATSTTGSTLYLLDQRIVVNNGLKQLWCRFGPNSSIKTDLMDKINGNAPTGVMRKWTDRHLYLGKNFNELPFNYKPVVLKPTIGEFVPLNIKTNCSTNHERTALQKRPLSLMNERYLKYGDYIQINRFGSGICEGCNPGLYLTVDDYILPERLSQIMLKQNFSSLSLSSNNFIPKSNFINYNDLAEASVRLWELYKETDPNKYKLRHRRRYGVMPQAHFLNGLGPWAVTPGGRYSVQVKRAVSGVTIKRQPVESELRLSISKKHLVASISCELLNFEKTNSSNSITSVPKNPVILFWTPDYWYRPKSAKDTYLQLQTHLNNINNYHKIQSQKSKGRRSKRNFLLWRLHSKDKGRDSDDELDETVKKERKRKSKFVYSNLFDNRVEDISDIDISKEPRRKPAETSLQYLKRVLQLHVTLTAWDYNSTTLAEQLTIIDRDLFLKIPVEELEVVLLKKDSQSAPNITAFIAFSHRISCLVSTEVLRDDSEKMRARLMARFINVADKCHRMSNFQSCKTVLCGLQSPAVYRLRRTWAYVRKKHALKYQMYEFLCRLYKDARSPTYQRTFFILSQNTAYLPYIGDVLAKLFNRIPEYRIQKKTMRSRISLSSSEHSNKSKSLEILHESAPKYNNLFTKLLKVFSNARQPENDISERKNDKKKIESIRKYPKFTGLCDYFKPLDCYEDNRMECLIQTTIFLEKCQLGAAKYCFSVNELARCYLLKARYKEELENFYNSLSTESSSTTSISNNKK